MQSLLLTTAVPALLGFAALGVTGFAFARMYKRSTREVSLVKTGTGGRKVIIDGGTMVIPVLHEITKINMRTTRLEVRRNGESALITKDRMRVDVGVEFYVTVEATEEGIAKAAQTLGDRTFDERALREMIEGKLVDGLRAVAAKMDLDDLHENRSNFVQQVQQTVVEDLKKNGLALESVSLTALDQTPLGLNMDTGLAGIMESEFSTEKLGDAVAAPLPEDKAGFSADEIAALGPVASGERADVPGDAVAPVKKRTVSKKPASKKPTPAS